MIINQYDFLYKIKWWIKKHPILILPMVSHNEELAAKREALFEFVEIETFNRCNGGCSFCPANKDIDKRKPTFMDEKLFYKIIDELAELNYSGRLALFSNNEPFLDKRMDGFIKYTRKKLPKAYIYIYCNGTLLTVERVKDIIDSLDKLVIDNYNDNLELIPSVESISKFCQNNSSIDKKIEIYVRKEHEVLSNRGNQAPNKKEKPKVQKIKCLLPFVQMVIRPDGKVSLCCNDVYGNYTMGDCNKNKLTEIWWSNRYKKVRKRIREQGRRGIKICRYCDNTTAAAVSLKYGKKRFLFSRKKKE